MFFTTRNYDCIYTYAKSHWKYHTFDSYCSCTSTKLRHKTQQKVRKCSITFPLKNGIITFYENCTNKYGRVDTIITIYYYSKL